MTRARRLVSPKPPGARGAASVAGAVAVAVVVVVAGGAGCVTLQVRTRGDVIVETDTGHRHYNYDATETFDLAPLFIACLATAAFYGGACWAYLALPFDDQEAVALKHARDDMKSVGDCAFIQHVEVEAGPFNMMGKRRARLVTLRGETVRIADAAALCVRPPPPAKVVSPRATSPPKERDPADP